MIFLTNCISSKVKKKGLGCNDVKVKHQILHWMQSQNTLYNKYERKLIPNEIKRTQKKKTNGAIFVSR